MQRVKVSLLCLLSLSLASVLMAQTAVDPNADVGSASLQDFSGGATLRGTYFDVRYMSGDGVGYRNGYTQIGAFTPFWLNGDAFVAPNARVIITDNERFGGNFGGVGRWYSANQDRIYGVNGYFDTDETSFGNRYQQATIGVESLGNILDFRANGYFALGTTDRFLQAICVGGDPYFVGNLIAFQGQQLREESMSGGDFEFGVPVSPYAPWIRAYAGAYGYQADGGTDPVGVRARLEATISDDFSVGVNVTDDSRFGTNVNAVVDFRFAGFKPTRYFPRFTTQERMLMPVQRNWRVSTGTYVQNVDIAAINPDTGNQYFVAHVDNSAAPGGDGTVEKPFNFLPASVPGADIIMVAAGTTTEASPLVGSISLFDNQRLLGEGCLHTAEMFAEYGDCVVDGTFVLPGATNSGNFPFLSSAGNIITLANNNEVAGFNLVNAFGAAITNGPGGSNNFLLQCLEITGNTGSAGTIAGGISLTDATGTGIIRGVNLNSGSTNHLNPPSPPNLGGLGDNGNFASTGGIFIDTGAAGLNLSMTDVAMNSNPGVQAFGVHLLADDGSLTTTMTNVEASGMAPGFGNSTAGIILETSNQVLNATLTDVSARNNTGAGVQIIGNGGSIIFNADNLIASGNGADNLQIGSEALLLPPVYPGPLLGTNFLGNVTNSVFDDSVSGSGVVFSMDGGQGSLTLTNVSAQNNFVDGMGIFGTNATSMVATVNDSFMNGNGRDGFHVEGTAGAIIDLTVDPTQVQFNGRDGLFFNLADSTLNVSFLDNLVDQNDRSAIHGEMDNSTLNLLFDNTTGNLSGGHGLFLQAVNGSIASLTVNNGTFADSGRLLPGSDGVHIESDASFVTLVMNDTPANNTSAPPAGTQRHGMFLDIQNGSIFDGTVTNGNFTNSLNHGLNATFGDSLASLVLDNTSLSNSGADGMNITVTGAGTDATITLQNGSLNDNSGEDGLDFHVNEGHLTVNATDSSFTNSGAGGVNGSGILGVIGDLAPGGLVNLNFTNTAVTNSLDNGMFVTAIDSNIQAAFDSSSISDNGLTTGGDGVRLDLDNSADSSLSLINGSNVDRNGRDGVQLNAINGTIFTGNFDTISISDNGQTASAGNGIVTNVDVTGAGSSIVNLTFNTVSVINNSPNTTQQVGFLFDVQNSGTMTAGFTSSNLSGNAQNAVNGSVASAGTATVNLVNSNADTSGAAGLVGSVDGRASTLNIGLDGVTVDGSGTFGALLSATAGGVLNVDGLSGTSISNSGGTGVFLTVDGALTEANIAFDTVTIDNNGFGIGGEGFSAAATGGGTLNVCLDNSSISNNANQGIELVVNGANSVANFGVELSTIDNNASEGLLVDVSNLGVLNYRSQLSSYSGNGANGTLDGVQATVTGTGALDTVTTARFLFSGDSVDGNTDDGFDFNATNGATIVASIANGTSASNNGGWGLQFNPSGAGTKAYLLMNGANQFNGNTTGPININNGVITGLDTAVISLSGSFDGANGDGIHLELIDVANAVVAIQGPGTIDGSQDNGGAGNGDNGDGIDIRIVNNTLATMNGSILISGFTSIDNSAGDGIHVEMTNTNLANTFNGALEISNIGSITGSGGDAIDVSLIGMNMVNGLTVPIVPVNVLTLTDSTDITTPQALALNQCLPVPVLFDLSASGLVPANALTINSVAAGNSAGRGINVLAQNSSFSDDGIAITNNRANNSQAGDGLHLDFDTVTSTGGGTLTGVLIDGNSMDGNSGNGMNFDLVNSPIDGLAITNNVAGVSVNTGLDFLISGDTFNGGTGVFTIGNTSDPGIDITGFTFDVSTVPPTVAIPFINYDASGFGGFPFTPFGGTDVTTGLASVNSVAVPPYPNTLVPTGSQLLDLAFTDFNPGEQFQWDADMDPDIGVQGTIQGNDLIGATINVNFTGGLTLGGTMQAVVGDPLGSQFVATSGNIGGNGIANNGLDGIRFSLNNSSLTNLVIDNNQIEANGTSGTGSGVNFQSVVNSNITNAVVSNNTIDGNDDDGFRLVNPDTAGSAIDLTFQDNTITNQTNGIGLNLQFNNAEVANINIESVTNGNNISNNGSLGVFVNSEGTSQVNLTVGGAGATNLIDGNVDAGLGVRLFGNANHSISVENTTFSNTTNGGNVLFNGGGMEITLGNAANVTPFTVGNGVANNTTFQDNAANGFSLLLNDTSSASALLIQNVTSTGNNQNQVRIDRRGNSVVNVTMNDSTLTGDATSLDGFSYNATNFQPATPLLVNLNNNTIGTNRDGVAIDLSANAQVVANIIENTIENNRGNGIRVTTQNAAAFGNPSNGTASNLLGNTITGNGDADGEAGIRLITLGGAPTEVSFQNVLIGESAGGVRTTLEGNRDGIRITDASAVVPFSTPVNNFQIQATDIIDSTNDGIRLDLSGVGTRVYIGDPLAAAQAQGSRDDVVITRTVPAPAGGNGIVVNAASGSNNVQIKNATIEYAGADGVSVAQTGGDILFNLQSTDILFSGQRGVFINVNNDNAGTTNNLYNVGGIGANQGVLIQNSSQQGLVFRTQSSTSASQLLDLGVNDYPGGAQIDPATPVLVRARMNLINAQVIANGTVGSTNSDGIVLAIGTNTRQDVLIAGTQVNGNVLDDVRIFPFVSVNPPADSVNNPTTAPPTNNPHDFLRLDPIARLDLVFGSIQPAYDSTTVPAVANPQATALIPQGMFPSQVPNPIVLATRNTGEQINVTTTGSAATATIAGSNGTFTTGDVFKAAGRAATLNGQVQIAPLSNTASLVDSLNQFIQNNVEQDLDAAFTAGGFTLNPANVFP